MNTIIAVFIGGGLGSLARFGIQKLINSYQLTGFPIATLISNTLACILLGLFISFTNTKDSTNTLLTSFIAIGFCGGFSTFSTFSLETVELLKTGNYLFASSNIISSLISCGIVLWLLVKTNQNI